MFGHFNNIPYFKRSCIECLCLEQKQWLVINNSKKSDWVCGWFHLQHMLWQLLPIVLHALQNFQQSAPFRFYSLFQEAWPMLVLMIIIKKRIVKKLWLLTSDFVCHVSGMGAAFTLLFGMIWREKLLFHQEQTYFQSSTDKDCGKLVSSLSQSF